MIYTGIKRKGDGEKLMNQLNQRLQDLQTSVSHLNTILDCEDLSPDNRELLEENLVYYQQEINKILKQYNIKGD